MIESPVSMKHDHKTTVQKKKTWLTELYKLCEESFYWSFDLVHCIHVSEVYLIDW